jgi:hypothetical protein
LRAAKKSARRNGLRFAVSFALPRLALANFQNQKCGIFYRSFVESIPIYSWFGGFPVMANFVSPFPKSVYQILFSSWARGR